MVDPAIFRDVMAQWPSGVTIVTTLDANGERKGMTASSFSSVSAEPALVSVCLHRDLYTHKLISESGVFGVNVLAKDQMEVARRFAGMVKDVEDRFEGEAWTVAETGVSLLDSALGWVDCRVLYEYEGGSHTIFVGEVLAAHNARRSAPLLYHSRGWGQFADVLPDVATIADTSMVKVLAQAGLADEIGHAIKVETTAGVRVRVADLSSAPEVDVALGAVDWPDDRRMTSVLVADSAQAQRVAAHGVGAVEVVADPTDPASVERALLAVRGLEDRAAVELVRPFLAERHEAVVEAVLTLKAAGVKEICLPDEGGVATALGVRDLLQEIVPMVRPTSLRMRLDARDRLGLVKGLTALKSGIRDFDTAMERLVDSAALEDLNRLLATLDVGSSVDSTAISQLAEHLCSVQTTHDLTAEAARTTVGAN